MSRTIVSKDKAHRASFAVTSDGRHLVFDESAPMQGDPVATICQWAIMNLAPEQISHLCMDLGDYCSASRGGATMEDEPTGFSGARYRREGPQAGSPGPWESKLPPLKISTGAQDGASRRPEPVLKGKALDDYAKASFDVIFGADETQTAGVADSFEALFDRGEVTPRGVQDLVFRGPLWVTQR